MSDIIDFNDIDDDYSGSLELVSNYTVKSKESIRKQLERDIRRFIRKGGKIDEIENQIVAPRYNQVGFTREGMTGSFHAFSRDSI